MARASAAVAVLLVGLLAVACDNETTDRTESATATVDVSESSEVEEPSPTEALSAPTEPPAPTTTTIPPTPRPPTATLPPPPPPSPTPICHPSYEGACLLIGAGDYDCAGGSGNGPNYTGRVIVVGPDKFDLDRDNDGIGCE